jgi:hypothetical protein
MINRKFGGFLDMQSQILAAFAAVGIVAGLSLPANANLVSNPGFEADDASGGPVLNPTFWNVSGNAGVDNQNPNSGLNDGFIGNGSLSQTVATMIGTVYNVSFYVDVVDLTLALDSSASFDATFGGTDVVGGPIAPIGLYGPYQQFTTQVTATSTSSPLTFTGVTSPGDGSFYVDDVDVEAQAMPEPWTILLMASALAGLGLVRRRAA